MTLTERAREVHTREQLAAFVEELEADLHNNHMHWSNADLASFLRAMAAWISDMDGYYANIGEDLATLPPWRIIADILIASRMYE